MAGPIAAIVLAAGFSQRMGEFKPLLDLGGETVLEKSVTLFRNAGINDIRVVTGHRAMDLEPLLARLGVRNVVNARYREGMFSSVAAGLATIEKDVEAFFVLPADIPLIRPATVRRLINSLDTSKHDAVYPVFRGERGHPPLIAGRLAEDITSWHGEGGLKAALAELASASLEVEVADGNILLDMDSPDDYRLLQEKALRLEIPTAEECRALLEGVLGVAEPL
ncbi:MAG TPA: nucleotidyltransferase family protein, partial [Geobacteraceae bacterium]